MRQSTSVLVLGIGNLLWADEGFGVRAVEALNRDYAFPDNVRLLDGGTQGLYLLDHITSTDILVVFDAVDYGLPPATLKLAENEDVPQFLGAKKMSLHQTGFQEVLATADLLGKLPRHLFLIGVQPVELEDYGGSLRDEVKARIPAVIDHALAYLARFGIEARRRETPLPESETIACQRMVLSRYEDERPDEDDACRVGDERVLAMAATKVAAEREGQR
ncbi:HyaD/HybD family hydrogenase maturation endopeptidase [Rhodomicrobium sp. Az07]|uniref:HyaD/HybD family hydrogenase maturation endopeptidase n=1 Tax=Rhodomicrobium sp. Az07 TaxID=2839034 RepID=UPI001BE8CD90|nr:HyaD/HybD family hydrogenase maturation endopeptidase [Rhodomicrobium sp. Az07]MBT3072056.1 HyaD/HybD family hydrogenase maturation endopeptidase [Rhodomicrobium sp. Az07]